jgi:hypothetical protein
MANNRATTSTVLTAGAMIMSLLSPSLVESASAGGVIAEIRGGVLVHNAPDLNDDPRGEDGLDATSRFCSLRPDRFWGARSGRPSAGP